VLAVQYESNLEKMKSRPLMTQLTIQVPDDIAQGLAMIAAEQQKTVEQVALERLTSIVFSKSSPQAILQAMRKGPHLSSSDVDEFEAAIASGRQPVNDRGVFDL
jgi:plasmid stability protein